MLAKESCESLPRINRQRVSSTGSTGFVILEIAKIKLVEVGELLFFLLGQRLFDQLAGGRGVHPPVFAEVLGNVPLLLRTEAAERPAEKDQGRRN